MGGVIQHARTRSGQLGARMWGQGMVQLGKLEISDAQQYMGEPGYYRLSGDAARRWEDVDPGEDRALIVSCSYDDSRIVPLPDRMPMWIAGRGGTNESGTRQDRRPVGRAERAG